MLCCAVLCWTFILLVRALLSSGLDATFFPFVRDLLEGTLLFMPLSLFDTICYG